MEKNASNTSERLEKYRRELIAQEQEYERCLLAEVLPSVAWQVGFYALLFSGLTFYFAFEENINDRAFGTAWLTLAVVQLTLMILLVRARVFADAVWFGLIASASVALWWVLSVSFVPVEEDLAALLLAILILGLGSMPWPLRYSLLLNCLYAVCMSFAACSFDRYSIFILLGLTCVPVALRISFSRYVGQRARLAKLTLVRCCQVPPSATTLIWFVSKLLLEVADDKRALVNWGCSSDELISRDAIRPSDVDQVASGSLVYQAKQSGFLDGVFARSELGNQFYPAFSDWFGKVPNGIFFAQMTAIIDDHEQEVTVFVPFSGMLRFAGSHRSILALNGIVSVVRIALAAQRSRFVSSGVLTATHRSISDQEEELNEIIHHVNNVAQDMSILTDALRQDLNRSQAGQPHLAPTVVTNLQRLEGAARSLSNEVSDIKLLRELLRLRGHERFEYVDVEALLSEILVYGDHRAYRRGEKFKIVKKIAGDKAVKIVSREYFETGLRLAIRAAGMHTQGNGEIRLSCEELGSSIRFLLEDDGQELRPELRKFLGSGQAKMNSYDAEYEYYAGLRNLLLASQGKLEVLEPDGNFRNRIACFLESVANAPQLRLLPSHWALLVDDNQE
ncbi:MAG: hypothetical protein KDD42_01045, partial [Bdellovibrionales bacterium]|nr:hypothetical protein [Bdellovibrionales bacterium]